MFGDVTTPLVIPPAYQAPVPFGTNVGPTNPQFWALSPESEYDSFLTIGLGGAAAAPGALSSIGIDFEGWTSTSGINAPNGAVRRAHFLHTTAR